MAAYKPFQRNPAHTGRSFPTCSAENALTRNSDAYRR